MNANDIATLSNPLGPIAAATAIIGLSLLLPIVPLSAQSIENSDNRATEVCMFREATAGMDTDPVEAVLPASNARTLLARGYRVIPCAQAFPSPEVKRAWRDRICALASEPNEFFQEQTERALGVRAAALCGMAEMIVGPWERQGARN